MNIFMLMGWHCRVCSKTVYEVCSSRSDPQIRYECCGHPIIDPLVFGVSPNKKKLVTRKSRYQQYEEVATTADADQQSDQEEPGEKVTAAISFRQATLMRSIYSNFGSILLPGSDTLSPENAHLSSLRLNVSHQMLRDLSTISGDLIKFQMKNMNARVPIGEGHVTINKIVLDNMDWSDAIKATKELLRDIFKHQASVHFSACKKSSPDSPDERPKLQLDQDMVNDIVTTVSMKASVPSSFVKRLLFSKRGFDGQVVKMSQEKKGLSFD